MRCVCWTDGRRPITSNWRETARLSRLLPFRRYNIFVFLSSLPSHYRSAIPQRQRVRIHGESSQGRPTHPSGLMPPKRKSPAVGSPRKTRSMAAAGKRGAEAAPAKAVPARKKEEEAAVAEQKGRKRAKKDEAVTAAAEPKGRKRGKKVAEEAAPAPAEEDGGDAAAEGKRVIVEAW
ncbi:hypothetical protein PVAP13_3NG215166 [Panicum virgatum]|uniref:Uncharacterized protein n=2 Tax=Panicum virgatum TaxID=38727 RepID=A0A8T0UF20_PANVG|nr:hypothetical protein PVAP13_3NG215166 [Panicum virgatum]